MAEFQALEKLEGPADYRRFDFLLSWIVWCLAMWDKGQRPAFEDFIFRWEAETEEEKQERIARQLKGVFAQLSGNQPPKP